MTDRRKKSGRRSRATPVLRVKPDGVEHAEIPHRRDRRAGDRRKRPR